jgi:hypothetical protein
VRDREDGLGREFPCVFGVEDRACECVGFGRELDVREGVDGGSCGSHGVLLLDGDVHGVMVVVIGVG